MSLKSREEEEDFAVTVVVLGSVDVAFIVVEWFGVGVVLSGWAVVWNVVVFGLFEDVVVKGFIEVVLDVVEEFWYGVVITGMCDVGVATVVELVFDVVVVEVVVGVGWVVVVIWHSTSHGQLQTSNVVSKYNCPFNVLGHWNRYAVPWKHT